MPAAPATTPATPAAPASRTHPAGTDPSQLLAPAWLSEITGERALAWARARSDRTRERFLSRPAGRRLTRDLTDLLDRTDRIPSVRAAHGMLYNLWTDAAHPRGLWRRTTWISYIQGAPARADRVPPPTTWEVLLDLDAESARTGRQLAWRGAEVLTTGPHAGQRALVSLSEGGADTSTAFELDLTTGQPVPPDQGGFTREASKGQLTWADDEGERVLVSDARLPTSSSRAGYPRQVRRRRRGQAPHQAEVLVTAGPDAVAAFAQRDEWGRTWLTTMPTFDTTRIWWLPDDCQTASGDQAALAALGSGQEDVPDGAVRLEVPESCSAGVGRDWLTIELGEPWAIAGRTYPTGTLLAAPLQDYLAGGRHLQVLFSPTATTSLASASWTRGHLVLSVLDDAVQRLEIHTPPSDETGLWARHDVDLAGTGEVPRRPGAEGAELRPGRALLAVEAFAVDARDTDYLWVSMSGWATPSSLAVGRITPAGELEGLTVVRQAPARFDATGVEVRQFLATSADGTRVPYFEIGRARAGVRPTLVQAYGAFGRSQGPAYDPVLGKAWLEPGGTVVVALTRGGGEYGPSWHQAAAGPRRMRAREDLEAVLASLRRRGTAEPGTTVLHGSSAGALLVGGLAATSPQEVAGVVLQAPVTDLGRYTRLGAGASWISELGDPLDPAQWAWMEELSPLHLLRDGVPYPPTLLVTSTRDDRVHPWHARAMAHRLESLGLEVSFLETEEGGHSGSATHAELARLYALIYGFAWEQYRSQEP